MNDEDRIEALERWEVSHDDTSEVLNDRPVFTLSLQWLWDAFGELSSARAYGANGPNRIQHSEVLAYCVIWEIVGKEIRDLSYCVRRMDSVWIDWAQKKSEKADGDET